MDTTLENVKTHTLGGLARQLVNSGQLDAQKAAELRRAAAQDGQPFLTKIIESGALTAGQVAAATAAAFSLPLIDLQSIDLDSAPLDDISRDLIRKHNVLPISRHGRRMTVAVSDPTNRQALREIQFQSGLIIEPAIADHDALKRIIEESFSDLDSAMEGLGDVELENIDPEEDDDDADLASNPEHAAPIVRFVNKVLLDAIRQGASDIHFEPYEKYFRIRLRQDGVLHEVARPPVGQGARLCSRVKVMSRLDLAERRVPQDGRMKIRISNKQEIDFRVSTCPTLYGEKIVLRILDSSAAQMGIEKLGYEEDQRAIFERTFMQPQGMVLVTGPTGSGKTVSLYTALDILNQEERNISTAEDPAEINLPGINQVNVRPRIGLTFASCLRAFLRQDPDVIMVGEIRDLETAEIAIKAAQTGHMVLSTVHTNNAPQTLTRLLNMGVPAYNIASSVSLIIAQRLARRLCMHCRVPANIPPEELLAEGFAEEELAQLTLYEANPEGCEYCARGYKGRIGIYQVMPVTEAIGNIIMEGGNANDIDRQARAEGVIDLRQAGLLKVRRGIIDLKEVNRVTVE
ncbi:MAG TPA: type IV-A pilus assembly ATPase PilB [Salinisphaeraceae bacterium]|nr:type IV-A pilus assembly ATPase PilB [Salinisphaeraceae bacterium]